MFRAERVGFVVLDGVRSLTVSSVLDAAGPVSSPAMSITPLVEVRRLKRRDYPQRIQEHLAATAKSFKTAKENSFV